MHKKKRVLFIGPLPPPFSGPELSMQQFRDSKLLNDTFDITFLQTNFREDNTKKGKFGFAMILNFFKFFSKLLFQLIFKRPKCIYYPITPTQIGWIGRDLWTILLSKFFGVKVIIHLRGSHFKLNFSQFSPLIQKMVSFGLRKVDSAIVQARYLEDQFAPSISKEKVEVLYQAMDLIEFPIESNEVVEEEKILVIGHMTKAKGYTDILKVIPRIVNEFPNVKFYFAGNIRKGERGVFFNQFTGEKINYEDPFEAEQLILNSKYSKNYINLGIIQGKEKLNHLQTSDIFLTASYSEGFSRALLEAMSVGKPLVFTPVGAHREAISNENGKSFIPGDLEGLYKAIKEMLNNKERKLLGLQNRKLVETKFSIEKITFDFKEIINKVLSR
jgi:glycosyltransferase involved in cell wall biosynthesis